MRVWLREKLVTPLLAQVQQGATPEGLAWSLSLGAVVGTVPLLGTTTLLCGLVGVAFKLNHVALQVANYVAYPVQLLCFLPLLGVGGRLLAAPVPTSIDALMAALQAGIWPAVRQFSLATAGALAVWTLLAIPAVFFLRLVFVKLLRKLKMPEA